MNSDQIAGKANEIKGKVKEKVGELMNDPTMQADGVVDQVKGKAQQTYGDVKEDVQEAIKKAGS